MFKKFRAWGRGLGLFSSLADQFRDGVNWALNRFEASVNSHDLRLRFQICPFPVSVSFAAESYTQKPKTPLEPKSKCLKCG